MLCRAAILGEIARSQKITQIAPKFPHRQHMLFVCYDLPDLHRGCVIENNNCVLQQKITQINLAGDFRFLSQRLSRDGRLLYSAHRADLIIWFKIMMNFFPV